MSEQIDIFDDYMNVVTQADKRIAHTEADLLHQTFALLRYNPQKRVMCFQTIYQKSSYGFNRPDYLDFTVGGHISANETILSGGIREIKEELGLDVAPQNLHYCFTRRIHKNIENYYINEFQHIFLNFYFSEKELCNKEIMEKEVKSLIEVSSDSLLDLLAGRLPSITGKEYIIKDSEFAAKNISLTSHRFIKDYLEEGLIETLINTINTYCKICTN